MKNVNMILAMSFLISSASALAFFDEPAPAEAQGNKNFRYTCEFTGVNGTKGKEQLRCEVKGLGCEVNFNDSEGRKRFKKCENSEDPIKIRCTDGFELFDDNASVDRQRDDDVVIVGIDSRRDAAAVLTLEDLDKRDDEVHATLLYGDEHSGTRLVGSCEVDFQKRKTPRDAE